MTSARMLSPNGLQLQNFLC